MGEFTMPTVTEIHGCETLINQLGLEPHPDGGWYKETWRSDSADPGGVTATAMLYLLEEGQRSHWHRIDATELWMWHAGSPLRLMASAADEGPLNEMWLGPDVLSGESPQHRIAPGEWHSAEAIEGWALVSCIISWTSDRSAPERAPEGWTPGN